MLRSRSRSRASRRPSGWSSCRTSWSSATAPGRIRYSSSTRRRTSTRRPSSRSGSCRTSRRPRRRSSRSCSSGSRSCWRGWKCPRCASSSSALDQCTIRRARSVTRTNPYRLLMASRDVGLFTEDAGEHIVVYAVHSHVTSLRPLLLIGYAIIPPHDPRACGSCHRLPLSRRRPRRTVQPWCRRPAGSKRARSAASWGLCVSRRPSSAVRATFLHQTWYLSWTYALLLATCSIGPDLIDDSSSRGPSRLSANRPALQLRRPRAGRTRASPQRPPPRPAAIPLTPPRPRLTPAAGPRADRSPAPAAVTARAAAHDTGEVEEPGTSSLIRSLPALPGAAHGWSSDTRTRRSRSSPSRAGCGGRQDHDMLNLAGAIAQSPRLLLLIDADCVVRRRSMLGSMAPDLGCGRDLDTPDTREHRQPASVQLIVVLARSGESYAS